jgi:hypothetical protein
MESKTTLEIIIETAEFAKEFNYFITVQLDGDGEKVNSFYIIYIIEKDSSFID